MVRDLFYPDATVRKMAAMLMQVATEDLSVQVVRFRDVLGIGRKRSIQILEYFDRVGLTRRLGDQRRIRQDNALAHVPRDV